MLPLPVHVKRACVLACTHINERRLGPLKIADKLLSGVDTLGQDGVSAPLLPLSHCLTSQTLPSLCSLYCPPPIFAPHPPLSLSILMLFETLRCRTRAAECLHLYRAADLQPLSEGWRHQRTVCSEELRVRRFRSVPYEHSAARQDVPVFAPLDTSL